MPAAPFPRTVLLAVVLCAGVHPLAAQRAPSFSRLGVSVGAALPRLAPSLADHWRVGPSPFFVLTSPYGRGILRLSLEAARFEALDGTLSDFTTLLPTLEWGASARLPLGLHGFAGAGAGVLAMDFGGGENPRELEVALAASLELRARIFGGWEVASGLSWRRILLDRPTGQPSMFIVLGRTIALPEVLRRAAAGDPAIPPETALDGAGEGAEPRPVGSGTWRAFPEAQGVLRLAEIPAASPLFDLATVDRRTLWLGAGGRAPLTGASPALLVDGIPVPVGPFGGVTPDRLPVSVGIVESARITALPAIAGGRLATDGTISLRTHTPARDGVEVFAEALAENPTGDPGPFAFIDPAAANVDKLGSGVAVGASWRLGPVAGGAGLRTSTDLLTDARLEGRTFVIRDPRERYPLMATRASWAHLRVLEGQVARHEVRFGASDRDALLFVPALGFEVPTRSALRHAGATGTFGGDALALTYLAHAASDGLAYDTNDAGLDFDLRLRTLGADLGVRWRRGGAELTLGGGFERTTARSGLLADEVARTTSRGRAGVRSALAAADLDLTAELRAVGGDVGPAVRGEARVPVGAASEVRLTAWDIRAPAAPFESLWTLHAAGYAFLETAGVEVDLRSPPGSLRDTGGELSFETHLFGDALRVRPFVLARSFRGLMLMDARYETRNRYTAPVGAVVVTGDGGAQVASAGGEAQWRHGDAIEVATRYRWTVLLGGGAMARAAWRAQPDHRLWQTLLWTPRPDLRAALVATVESASDWAGYELAGGGRIGGGATLALSVEKTLWDGRVRLNGRLSDLLDGHRPQHPLGMAPGLSAAVGMSARLGR